MKQKYIDTVKFEVERLTDNIFNIEDPQVSYDVEQIINNYITEMMEEIEREVSAP